MEAIYTARATATGGRNGQIKSVDGALKAEIRAPKEMGGPTGIYLNPETLFAAGYAACFDSALNRQARLEKMPIGITTVTASVSIGKLANGGFGLAVVLEVEIPELDKARAEALVNKAHEICPYSNATRGNIDVQLVVK